MLTGRHQLQVHPFGRVVPIPIPQEELPTASISPRFSHAVINLPLTRPDSIHQAFSNMPNTATIMSTLLQIMSWQHLENTVTI